MANMVLNAEDIAFTKLNEGCPTNRAGLCVAYRDSRGIWTIGWGHTPAHEGQTETQAQADSTFSTDKASYIAGVNRNIKVPMTQHQFGAFCDFSFNIGVAGFAGSNTCRLFNAGDKVGAGKAFFGWLKPADLYGRRVKELAYYNKPDSVAKKTSTPAKNNANTTAQQDAKKKADALVASNALKAKQALDASNKAKAIQAQKVLDQAKLTKNQKAIDDAQAKLNAVNKTTKATNSVAPEQKVLKSGFTIVGLIVTIIFFKYGFDL